MEKKPSCGGFFEGGLGPAGQPSPGGIAAKMRSFSVWTRDKAKARAHLGMGESRQTKGSRKGKDGKGKVTQLE